MDLLATTEINPRLTTVIFYAADGYSTSLPREYLEKNNILIAYKMKGVTLSKERGFPFQLVAESKWGYKWIKWITTINSRIMQVMKAFRSVEDSLMTQMSSYPRATA